MPRAVRLPEPRCWVPRFDGPLTVIAGANSDYVAQRDGAAFRPMFSQVEIEVIEDAGHWVHADQPEAFRCSSVRRALQQDASAPAPRAQPDTVKTRPPETTP